MAQSTDPIQLRVTNPTSRRRLKNAASKSGITQVEIIRLAIEEMFERYPNGDALVKAYYARRQKEAAAANS